MFRGSGNGRLVGIIAFLRPTYPNVANVAKHRGTKESNMHSM